VWKMHINHAYTLRKHRQNAHIWFIRTTAQGGMIKTF